MIAAIAAMIAAAASAAFVGRQFQLANRLAGTSEIRQVMAFNLTVESHLLQYPQLRPCFYDSADGADLDELSQSRLATLAALYADVLGVGLFTVRSHRRTKSHEDWLAYARFMLDQSPSLDNAVEVHREWWPLTAALKNGTYKPPLFLRLRRSAQIAPDGQNGATPSSGR